MGLNGEIAGFTLYKVVVGHVALGIAAEALDGELVEVWGEGITYRSPFIVVIFGETDSIYELHALEGVLGLMLNRAEVAELHLALGLAVRADFPLQKLAIKNYFLRKALAAV